MSIADLPAKWFAKGHGGVYWANADELESAIAELRAEVEKLPEARTHWGLDRLCHKDDVLRLLDAKEWK